MKKVALISRLLLGLIYFVFGLNGFFQFLKMQMPHMSDNAMAFVTGMVKSGFFMPLVSGTQVVGGFLLLSGFLAPLGLVILAPMTLNIVLFHVFLTPGLQNLGLPGVMLVLHLLAATGYWDKYRPLFSK